MASNLIMNGTTYDGTPISTAHPLKPTTLTVADAKIGKTQIAYNGNRTFIYRGARKKTWTIGWPLANETTRAAVRTLHELTTTWTFVDEHGTSYTVQTEADDLSEDYAMTTPANAILYDVKLTVREA